MQHNDSPQQPIHTHHIRPSRLIKHPRNFFADGDWEMEQQSQGQQGQQISQGDITDVASLPTQTLSSARPGYPTYPPRTPQISLHPFSPMQRYAQTPAPFVPTTPTPDPDEELLGEDVDLSQMSTMQLMRLSGMIRAVQPPQQGGAFPVQNSYARAAFEQTGPQLAMPHIAVVPVVKEQPRWKKALNSPIAKIALGLVIGVGMLYLVTKFINVSDIIIILKKNLTTPRGIVLALLTGASFLTAFAIRGLRWKLFLNPIGKVSAIKAIQLFMIGMFLNFILPVRGGEVAKSLMLKRIANIPISRSLPTVAMDKALDLMPALFIMALVPLLGIHMDIELWLILGAVGGLLVCLIFFIALAAWKRSAAIALLQKMTHFVPGSVGNKIADFATGFVDSLLAGASQPKIFLPAVGLTIIAVIFDGLFAMLAFWTIGLNIPFGTALFGYTVYNMYYILPTPPGEVGSNEIVGLLVFHGLLQQPAASVTAMFVFSHPLTALLMTVSGMIGLSGLGLSLTSAMTVQTEGSKSQDAEQNATVQPRQVVRA